MTYVIDVNRKCAFFEEFFGIKSVRYFLSYDGQAGKPAKRAEARENNERDTVRQRPKRKCYSAKQHFHGEGDTKKLVGMTHPTYVMQNKANFHKGQTDVSFFVTKDYENICPCEFKKNKPNQSQFPNRKTDDR
jgi:hypothetical protein